MCTQDPSVSKQVSLIVIIIIIIIIIIIKFKKFIYFGSSLDSVFFLAFYYIEP